MIPAISGAIGPLGAGEWGVSGVGSLGAGNTVGSASAAAPTGSGSFGSALSSAIDSLQNSQATATQSSQALATGQLTDPTQAVTAVENASLSMDLAAQLRDKFVQSVNQVFQTQI